MDVLSSYNMVCKVLNDKILRWHGIFHQLNPLGEILVLLLCLRGKKIRVKKYTTGSTSSVAITTCGLFEIPYPGDASTVTGN